MKKLIFRKGITRIDIPFLLTNFEPWQDQVSREMTRFKKKYTYRKDAQLGYQIKNGFAELTLSI
jgi:hypothetical protein